MDLETQVPAAASGSPEALATQPTGVESPGRRTSEPSVPPPAADSSTHTPQREGGLLTQPPLEYPDSDATVPMDASPSPPRSPNLLASTTPEQTQASSTTASTMKSPNLLSSATPDPTPNTPASGQKRKQSSQVEECEL